MEAASLAFSVAQTLLATLQSSEQLHNLFSMFGYKSELVSLQDTVNTIKSVLLDAEAKEALTHQQQNFVQNLKAAIYDADDLIDEFNTLAEQHQLLIDQSPEFSKKVRRLFSRFEKLPVRYRISREVEKIQKRLDTVAKDVGKFCFKVDNQPIMRRREESCSHLYGESIIGREKELADVVSMLLTPNVQGRNISFITIVGMGGLGKTALAQLVYHHESIKREYSHRWWVCVADQDQRSLDVKTVLCKILNVAKGRDYRSSTLELVQIEFQKHVEGKRFLLILDDVWNEVRNEWSHLASFLMKGDMGSCIVITTRSKETAMIVGQGPMYELQGLSEKNAWNLFEMMAFEKGQKQAIRQDLVDIGRAIVKKCAGVPLAIRAIGSLLFGQKLERWRSFQQCGVASITKDKGDIMPILNLSYLHLDSPLKSCFSYCAVFPKDSVIMKEMLIQLWMAQGYVEPANEYRSIEDILEDYFLILLRRCFFQDVKKNKDGTILSCKMHDLMHDVAQSVTGKEMCIVETPATKLDVNTRHLTLLLGDSAKVFGIATKIRTCLTTGFRWHSPTLTAALENSKYLRVLDLQKLAGNSLPSSIGTLVHLRYLDLSYGDLEELPRSITKLHNLETLKLECCGSLKKLPKDIYKLIKLRVLNVIQCPLTHMPVGMDKLTCLRELTTFVVAKGSSDRKQSIGQLQDLGSLTKLKGKLFIQVSVTASYAKKDDREAGYLSNKEHLNCIFIWWDGEKEVERVSDGEQLLEDLKPHPNLKELHISSYHGVTIPKWMKDEHLTTSLPNLVRIYLSGCTGLQHLPSFSKLPNLKALRISYFSELEFMEDPNSKFIKTSVSKFEFFPSLEKLSLDNLPKLKGWWKGIGVDDDGFPLFPCLSKLKILFCSNLTSIPFCPTLRQLKLQHFNKSLQPLIKTRSRDAPSSSVSSHLLKDIYVSGYAGYVKSLPMEAFKSLDKLVMLAEKDVECLSELSEVLQSCSSSLRSLDICGWPKLRSLDGGGRGLEHLTALTMLELRCLDDLDLAGGNGDEDIPWKCFGQSLHHLSLWNLPKLVNMPKGMRHLSALKSLSVLECFNLKTIPEWMGCLSSLNVLLISSCYAIQSMPEAMRDLTSLRELHLYDSPVLKERCQSPNGEDWPNIRHIPLIVNC